MELFKIKKSYRNGDIELYLLLEDDLSKDDLTDAVEEKCIQDYHGYVNGYSCEYEKVFDKDIILSEANKEKKIILRLIESSKRKIEEIDKMILELEDK